jgi:hypothetical protein
MTRKIVSSITEGAYNKWRKKSKIIKLITNNNKKETMKKLITNASHFLYALLATVLLLGCEKPQGEKTVDSNKGYNVKTIDGCEYIEVDSGIGDYYRYTLTHKGNCVKCLVRNAK